VGVDTKYHFVHSYFVGGIMVDFSLDSATGKIEDTKNAFVSTRDEGASVRRKFNTFYDVFVSKIRKLFSSDRVPNFG
jgi:hypothetical protein